MATKLDKIKWKLYNIRNTIYTVKGTLDDKIQYYDDDLIDKLSHVYFGGIPASVTLLTNELCNGMCYDRAVLLTTGFDKDDSFRVIRGNVASLALNPLYIDKKKTDSMYAEHCVVERIENGIAWIYDTSACVKIERDLYYKMQKFDIRHISSKEETINYFEYRYIKNADIEKDKYVLPITMPLVEEIVYNSQSFYKERVIKILEDFKKEIHYDDIINQINEDMKNKRKILK